MSLLPNNSAKKVSIHPEIGIIIQKFTNSFVQLENIKNHNNAAIISENMTFFVFITYYNIAAKMRDKDNNKPNVNCKLAVRLSKSAIIVSSL